MGESNDQYAHPATGYHKPNLEDLDLAERSKVLLEDMKGWNVGRHEIPRSTLNGNRPKGQIQQPVFSRPDEEFDYKTYSMHGHSEISDIFTGDGI